MPFVGLADPDHVVAGLYGQEVSLLKLGRVPALVVVDRAGRIRLSHYAANMADIPSNRRVLDLLDRLNGGSQS
jgi:peroxiredoxin